MTFRKFFIPTIMAGLAVLTSANQAVAIGIGNYSGYQDTIAGTVYNGTLSIEKTYACSEGTCFKGKITFPDVNQSNLVVGYWSGSLFTMRRYTDSNGYVQTFNGIATSTGVSGSWFTDADPAGTARKGNFSLNQ